MNINTIIEKFHSTSDCEKFYKLLNKLGNGNDVESRAYAIKVLAELSNQRFNAGLPTDPGYWKLEQFPLEALKQWRANGYPGQRVRGTGGSPSSVQSENRDRSVSVRTGREA